jgi:hypothetical protein
MKPFHGVIEADAVYSISMLEHIVGVSAATVRRWMASGLPYAQVGDYRFVSGRDFQSWVEQQARDQAECEAEYRKAA